MSTFTDVAYGLGAVSSVPALVEQSGVRRVLLVTGKTSFEASGAAGVLPELRRVAEVYRWSDFAANVDARDLVEGLQLAESYRPDTILGIGGGSVMDMAKLLTAFAPRVDTAGVLGLIRGGAPVADRSTGLILAPTTSGSGSEATHFAVVYVGGDKFSVAGPALRPDRVVLDPCLSLSASPYQRAVSGIDAICQAIESTWAVGATDESRRHAEAALSYLLPSIETWVKYPSVDGAVPMCVGSHLAGRAIDVSKTTGAHALSYSLTARFGISHGHAVALTLGAFIDAHADADEADLQAGLDAVEHEHAMEKVFSSLGAKDAPGALDHFHQLMKAIELETHLSRLGVGPADVPFVVAGVNTQRLANNPVVMTRDDLRSIVAAAL